jgi:hypothetical protein
LTVQGIPACAEPTLNKDGRLKKQTFYVRYNSLQINLIPKGSIKEFSAAIPYLLANWHCSKED